jgi:hypothetical protein
VDVSDSMDNTPLMLSHQCYCGNTPYNPSTPYCSLPLSTYLITCSHLSTPLFFPLLSSPPGSHTLMIQTLLNAKHNMPTLLLITPAEAKGFMQQARGLFQQEMCFFFICPVTKKPAKSGKCAICAV